MDDTIYREPEFSPASPLSGSSGSSGSSSRRDASRDTLPGRKRQASTQSTTTMPSKSRSGAGTSGKSVRTSESASEQAVKHFVLDTNILLHNPDAMFVFKEHNVIIPFQVIEELDKMKRKDDDLGRNARGAIRNLDRLRQIGALADGVNWGQLPAPSRGAFSTGPGGKTGFVRIDVTD